MNATADTAAFTITAPRRVHRPIVVHVPHSASVIPADVRAQLLLNDAEIANVLLLMTDHRTEQLVCRAGECGATRMVKGWSRLAVDPERFLDPQLEEMEAVGMGAVYTRTSHGSLYGALMRRSEPICSTGTSTPTTQPAPP